VDFVKQTVSARLSAAVASRMGRALDLDPSLIRRWSTGDRPCSVKCSMQVVLVRALTPSL
jgi:hypothetical protein